MALLARRLPPGLLRDLARFIPDGVTTIRRLRRDPRVPRRAKVVVALAGLWLLSPIDLLPQFLPVIGPLDDLLVIALALRYAARQVPREVLVDAWPGEPRLLERLLGGPAPATASAWEPALASGPIVSCEAGGQRLLWGCRKLASSTHTRGLVPASNVNYSAWNWAGGVTLCARHEASWWELWRPGSSS